MVATTAQRTKAARKATEKAAQAAIDQARESAQAQGDPAFTPERFLEPDFVDQVFAYLLAEFPQLFSAEDPQRVKAAVRDELGGVHAGWVRRAPDEGRRRQLGPQVLHLFNGRNATEVARRLRISRATVYRLLKQQGRR